MVNIERIKGKSKCGHCGCKTFLVKEAYVRTYGIHEGQHNEPSFYFSEQISVSCADCGSDLTDVEIINTVPCKVCGAEIPDNKKYCDDCSQYACFSQEDLIKMILELKMPKRKTKKDKVEVDVTENKITVKAENEVRTMEFTQESTGNMEIKTSEVIEDVSRETIEDSELTVEDLIEQNKAVLNTKEIEESIVAPEYLEEALNFGYEEEPVSEYLDEEDKELSTEESEVGFIDGLNFDFTCFDDLQ